MRYRLWRCVSASSINSVKRLLLYRRYLLLAGVLVLAGCNMPESGASLSPTMNVTQAYQTVEARLTAGVALTPSFTAQPEGGDLEPPSDTPTATLTPGPATATSGAPTSTSPPSQKCDQAAPANPIDVTIPDDTQMQPGQSFTKIWRLQNQGTCTWTNQYAAVFFSGERMEAPPVVSLAGEVSPGQTVDISIDMVAPEEPGTYQGNWKLRNASNVLFGIGPNGSAPFWVRIVVVPTPTETPTPATTTPTMTPTSTPPVQTSGQVALTPGDLLDLDSREVNSGAGQDLSYESDPEGNHLLVPQSSALIGVYGSDRPTMDDCLSADMAAVSITVEMVPSNAYLCYRSGQGLPGRASIANFDIDTFTLTLDILTWSLP
jgi:hypothetical protein